MKDLLYLFFSDIKDISEQIFIDEIICSEKLTISKIKINLNGFKEYSNFFNKLDYIYSIGLSSSMFYKDNYFNNNLNENIYKSSYENIYYENIYKNNHENRYLKKQKKVNPERSILQKKKIIQKNYIIKQDYFKKNIEYNNLSLNSLIEKLDLSYMHNRAILLSIINAVDNSIFNLYIGDSISIINELYEKQDKNYFLHSLSHINLSYIDLIFKNVKNLPKTKKEILYKSIKNYKFVKHTGSVNYKGKKVAMIGYFKPFVKYIRSMTKEIGIIDLNINNINEAKRDGFKIIKYDELDNFDLILVSATSIINNTLLDVLNFIKDAKVVLMGPSAPIFYYHFIKNNLKIDFIEGRLVIDYKKAKSIIKNGGSTKDLKKSSIKIETFI